MELHRQRRQQLFDLAQQLAPIGRQIQESSVLNSFDAEFRALQASVQNALLLHVLLEKYHIVAPDQLALGYFGLLPDEIIMHLFGYFKPEEVLATRRVCQKWKKLSEESGLWKGFCEAEKFSQPQTRSVPWEWLFKSKKRTFRVISPLVNGVGRHCYEDGCSYEGDWHTGKRHGFGVDSAPGTRYEGDWLDDKRHGRGCCRFPNGSIYEGEYRAGLPEGKGMKRWPNGSCYVGDWKNGLQDGRGSLQWQDGEKYEGEWAGGFQTGCGRYSWPDGDEYDGSWQRDLLHGYGKHSWHDGCSFVGEWLEGKRFGYGVYKWPDGSVYEGQFQDSKRHGNGAMRWADGTSFVGVWKSDFRVVGGQVQSTNKLWDLFFHKNYEQQRAYVKEIMQQDSHRQVASLT